MFYTPVINAFSFIIYYIITKHKSSTITITHKILNYVLYIIEKVIQFNLLINPIIVIYLLDPSKTTSFVGRVMDCSLGEISALGGLLTRFAKM